MFQRHNIARDWRPDPWLLAALGVALLAWLPIWYTPGFLNTRAGGDSPFLLVRLSQLLLALEQGQFPVRWMPDAAYGLGYPFYHYYAPLAFYIAALFNPIGGGLIIALKQAHLVAFLLAAWAMYRLAEDIRAQRPAAFVASVVYTLAPFHLINMYVRGDSIGEFYAMAFYPLLLWGLRRTVRQGGRASILYTGLAYAALVLSHNISALIFTPFAFTYAAVLWLQLRRQGALPSVASRWSTSIEMDPLEQQRRLRLAAATAAAGFLLGLALSAWFWLPALGESRLVQVEQNLTGFFAYAGHFRNFDLLQPTILFDFSVREDGNPFRMGLVQTLLLLGGMTALIWRRPTLEQGAIILFTLLATLLITPLSKPLWDYLPLLEFAQFPWRFLSVQACWGALLVAALIPDQKPRPISKALAGALYGTGRVEPRPKQILYRRWWHPRALAIVLAAAALVPILPVLRVDMLPIRDENVSRANLAIYELFTGNIGSTIRAEYLPAGVIPRPWGNPALPPDHSNAPIALQGQLIAYERQTPDAWEWTVQAAEPGVEVAFPLYHFAGHFARVDDDWVETDSVPQLGWTQVSIPAGEHTITLHPGRTTLRRLAEIISLLALLFAAGLLLWERHEWRRYGWSAGAVFLFIVVLGWIAPRPAAPATDLHSATMDFTRQPLLHPALTGIAFEEEIVLEGYAIRPNPTQAGKPVEFIWRWMEAPPPGYTLEVALIWPSAHLEPEPGVLAQLQAPAQNTDIPLLKDLLVVPSDLPPGPYFLRLRLRNSEGQLVNPLDAQGVMRGDIYLEPLWVVTEGSAAAMQRQVSSHRVNLHEPLLELAAGVTLWAADTTHQRYNRLHVALLWEAERSLPGSYVTSLRVHGPDGRTLAQLDRQPAYGAYPTWAWQPSQPWSDHRWLELPPGLPPGPGYEVEILMYEAATLAPLGAPARHKFALSLPTIRPDQEVIYNFDTGLALVDMATQSNVIEAGSPWRWRAVWKAESPMAHDLWAHMVLIHESGAETLREPFLITPNYRTSRWLPGTVIEESYKGRLPANLKPGEYRLRIAVGTGPGQTDAVWDSPVSIQVTPTTRTFNLVPPAGFRMLSPSVTFGDEIALIGTRLTQEADELQLELFWYALGEPDGNYHVFVHLFRPEDEQIVAQHDGAPRQGTYPTEQWVAGEFVNEDIVLSLSDVPAGDYRLAVGLYRPETGERLPAVADAGRLGHDRVVLDNVVEK